MANELNDNPTEHALSEGKQAMTHLDLAKIKAQLLELPDQDECIVVGVAVTVIKPGFYDPTFGVDVATTPKELLKFITEAVEPQIDREKTPDN